jgi:hypothetical protein
VQIGRLADCWLVATHFQAVADLGSGKSSFGKSETKVEFLAWQLPSLWSFPTTITVSVSKAPTSINSLLSNLKQKHTPDQECGFGAIIKARAHTSSNNSPRWSHDERYQLYYNCPYNALLRAHRPVSSHPATMKSVVTVL